MVDGPRSTFESPKSSQVTAQRMSARHTTTTASVWLATPLHSTPLCQSVSLSPDSHLAFARSLDAMPPRRWERSLARFLARAPAVPTRPPPPLSLSLTHMYVLCFAVVFVLYFALLRGARRRTAATELGARASGRISCLCPRRSEVQALPSPLQGMPALPAPAAPITVLQSQLPKKTKKDENA